MVFLSMVIAGSVKFTKSVAIAVIDEILRIKNLNVPVYAKLAMQNLNKFKDFSTNAFQATNWNMHAQHLVFRRNIVELVEWSFNAGANYTTCLTNNVLSKIGGVDSDNRTPQTNCDRDRPTFNGFTEVTADDLGKSLVSRRLEEGSFVKQLQWNSNATVFDLIYKNEKRMIQMENTMVAKQNHMHTKLDEIKRDVKQALEDNGTIQKRPKAKKNIDKELFTRRLTGGFEDRLEMIEQEVSGMASEIEAMSDEITVAVREDVEVVVKNEVGVVRSEVVSIKEEMLVMNDGIKEEMMAMKDMMLQLIRQNQELINQNKELTMKVSSTSA